jgi:predicted kinase
MKDTIKKILREEVEKNALGSTVSRPDQVLIIMRGIPGAGKSTKARELKGSGEIFSTDDRIEAQGDYNEFFSNMFKNGNYAPIGKMHATNFKMAEKAMKSGVSPVIVDNTNIRPDEPKNYIESALNMGYANENIKFVDVGTGGLSAEELAERNTHGVPLGKISQMIQAHKSVGPLSLEKVINSKSRFDSQPDKPKKILYSAVVLDDFESKRLLNEFKDSIPEGWKTFAHHMTIVFGKGLPEDLEGDLGKEVTLTVKSLGVSDKAIAVGVEGYYSNNDKPHITLAVNTSNKGKPYDSNNIEHWKSVKDFAVKGIVTEITP